MPLYFNINGLKPNGFSPKHHSLLRASVLSLSGGPTSVITREECVSVRPHCTHVARKWWSSCGVLILNCPRVLTVKFRASRTAPECPAGHRSPHDSYEHKRILMPLVERTCDALFSRPLSTRWTLLSSPCNKGIVTALAGAASLGFKTLSFLAPVKGGTQREQALSLPYTMQRMLKIYRKFDFPTKRSWFPGRRVHGVPGVGVRSNPHRCECPDDGTWKYGWNMDIRSISMFHHQSTKITFLV
jgi:hypothetical protein